MQFFFSLSKPNFWRTANYKEYSSYSCCNCKKLIDCSQKSKSESLKGIGGKKLNEPVSVVLDEENNGKISNECNVCMSNPKDAAFIPCGHVCCCLLCAEKIIRGTRKCPICRTHIISMHKVIIT
jgi:hypothetical protein